MLNGGRYPDLGDLLGCHCHEFKGNHVVVI